nr:FAR1 DNA binding domain-containing protein [Tanacetum cinerariifolium]
MHDKPYVTQTDLNKQLLPEVADTNVEDPNVLPEFLPEDKEDVLPEVSDLNVVMEEVTEGHPIPVEGAYYDTIDEALDMYTKYAEMAGFEIKKGGQRLTKSGAVQHKYIYCNKEGVPKGINVDTLDPEYYE